MNPNLLIHISEVILSALVLSLVALTQVYILQHYQLLQPLSTVSWNG